MHLHLGLDDYLFDDLNRKLKSSGASEYIHSLKEMYVDFMGMMSFFFCITINAAHFRACRIDWYYY